VLRGVASALLGRDAMQGGVGVAALGLAMHFFVALCAAAMFYALSRKFPALVRHALSAGIVYGAVVYFVMSFAVLPLCAQVRSLYLANVVFTTPRINGIMLGIHVVFVGPPIALMARRYGPR